ncbi:MAG: hypothetical protein BTN85_0905 [Candidatus Methanohalarchaeum thermophilum]|uniref:Uncharacterized protein n=1 Tax=Methanohalarchaeum thermophilum TaxID=1903181 RepID=A0A1Q6DVM9_METT1|nr:MAG: hypothetical protein BTN85_0905 [Candidatus Methanohalarchaeum thermophilum]
MTNEIDINEENVDEDLKKKADFCKDKCPVCNRAREGKKISKFFVKHIDRKVCPMCKAYEEVYGKKAYE